MKRKEFIELLKDYALIKEMNGEYFSACILEEEITNEIKEIAIKVEKL